MAKVYHRFTDPNKEIEIEVVAKTCKEAKKTHDDILRGYVVEVTKHGHKPNYVQ
jgi:hypothetical protein